MKSLAIVERFSDSHTVETRNYVSEACNSNIYHIKRVTRDNRTTSETKTKRLIFGTINADMLAFWGTASLRKGVLVK
jgi:hypothetical protein